MPANPDILPLSRRDRRNTFLVLVIVFLIAMPLFVFYAMGYRYTLFGDETGLVGTGGLYIASLTEDTDIYLDESEVRSPRVFRSATYIQGLTPAMHRVHVQGAGLETWVKELPVLPHIVTEASAFTLPSTPQVRPIPQYLSVGGQATYPGVSSTTLPFSSASSSIMLHATSTQFTRSLIPNTEYTYINSLFASTTSTSTTLVDRVIGEVNTAFRFGTSPDGLSTTSATTTIERGDVRLIDLDGDLYAEYIGNRDRIPYYYCVLTGSTATTSAWYGAHVAESVAAVTTGEAPGFVLERNGLEQVCRTSIKIDRLRQEVQAFTFLPGSTDHVLLHLEDGIYVVEIDDRAWQNTQLLYPGRDITMVVDGRQIFVKDGEYYAEVFTELNEN